MSTATVELPVTKASGRAEDTKVASVGHESWLVGAVLLLTAAVYAATLRFDFVYDDLTLIVTNRLLTSWKYVPQYFRQDVFHYSSPDIPGNYYRPLYLLWFRVNYAIFGLNHVAWHATTILLHLVVTALVYFVVRRMFGRPLLAAATALLFGVHPMKHEVVAWIACTSESLWCCFFLGGFLAYLIWRENRRPRWMALSCLLYAAALLSKETAFVLPAVVFAHAWIYGDGDRAERGDRSSGLVNAVKTALIYLPIAVAYLWVRVKALHGFSHAGAAMGARTLLETVPSVVFFYLSHWLVPVRIAEFYDLRAVTKFSFAHVLGPALAVFALGVLAWLMRKKLGSRNVAFAAAWVFLLLLPALDLAVLPPEMLVQDRYFYLASLGASLLVALALEKLAYGVRVWGVPQRWLLAMLVLALPLCYGTANAASYWKNQYTLFRHSYESDPHSVVAQVNYGNELARRGDYATALPILQQAVKDAPKFWLTNYNLGWTFYQAGILNAAEPYLERTKQLRPRWPKVYLELGLLQLRENRLDAADASFREAVRLLPEEPALRFALGAELADRGNCEEARSEFAKTLEYDPTYPHAREQLEKCSEQGGQSVAAPQNKAN